jgi:DNA-directed RNA polymerase subunit M/transcription elongation factor TFIIS
MGRKAKARRFKREQENQKKRQILAEQTLKAKKSPNNCPKCGEQLVRSKIRRAGFGGVLGEGSMGNIYLGDSGSMVNRDRGLVRTILGCPRCGYQMEIDETHH